MSVAVFWDAGIKGRGGAAHLCGRQWGGRVFQGLQVLLGEPKGVPPWALTGAEPELKLACSSHVSDIST